MSGVDRIDYKDAKLAFENICGRLMSSSSLDSQRCGELFLSQWKEDKNDSEKISNIELLIRVVRSTTSDREPSSEEEPLVNATVDFHSQNIESVLIRLLKLKSTLSPAVFPTPQIVSAVPPLTSPEASVLPVSSVNPVYDSLAEHNTVGASLKIEVPGKPAEAGDPIIFKLGPGQGRNCILMVNPSMTVGEIRKGLATFTNQPLNNIRITGFSDDNRTFKEVQSEFGGGPMTLIIQSPPSLTAGPAQGGAGGEATLLRGYHSAGVPNDIAPASGPRGPDE